MHRNLVLLGASNLSRGFARAVGIARSCFDERLSFYVAKGSGRSYGTEAGAFGKKFPGISSCGIWSALERAKSAPTNALITDIGNDLGYEVPVETILQWVEGCVERLLERDAKIVISDLPIESIRCLSERRYRLFRSVLFPQCRVEWDEMLCRLAALQAGVRQLAETHFIPVFPVETNWYGFDPIHPRAHFLDDYFAGMFNAGDTSRVARSTVSSSWLTSAYLQLIRAESWTNFGVQRSCAQPTGRLRDGTEIFLH